MLQLQMDCVTPICTLLCRAKTGDDDDYYDDDDDEYYKDDDDDDAYLQNDKNFAAHHFTPGKFCGKVRKSQQNINRDICA